MHRQHRYNRPHIECSKNGQSSKHYNFANMSRRVMVFNWTVEILLETAEIRRSGFESVDENYKTFGVIVATSWCFKRSAIICLKNPL